MAWTRHFRVYPPGDFYTQHMLATLIILVHSGLGGGKNHKSLELKDVAPHLVTPAMKETNRKAMAANRARTMSDLLDKAGV